MAAGSVKKRGQATFYGGKNNRQEIKKEVCPFLMNSKTEKVACPLLFSFYFYTWPGPISCPVHLLYLSIDTQPSAFYTTIN
jgi:hypothetical protein